MGRKKREWQDRDYVLRWFGKKEKEAKRDYRQYVKEGIAEGRREDLVGGGLGSNIRRMVPGFIA